MTFTQAVAKRTKDLLFANNLTQYKLCKTTCIDKTTIQTIFKGKTKDVRISTIFLIADFFNMTLKEFFDSPYFDKSNLIY